tara:strand:+ start:8290 stop:9228 length:939 start_codon:yes stop_codon:yes gene_type:complete
VGQTPKDRVPITQATEQLLRLLDQTGVMVALYDGFDRLRYANPTFRDCFGLTVDEEPTWAEVMRRNHPRKIGTIIKTDNFEKWLMETQARRGKTRFKSYETDLHDGRWLQMTETVQADGWMLCIATDISGLRVEDRSVRQDRDLAIRASQTDELTGIANRRFVTGRLADMLAIGGPLGDPLGCVCILDIDHFKSINDRFGHSGGDMVLRDFARTLLALLRRNDTFGRIGGEEFMLVLPDTTPEEAQLVIERMLYAVRRSQPMGSATPCRYSFSAGLSGCRIGDTIDDVYTRADNALYAAKQAGRDRIILSGS